MREPVPQITEDLLRDIQKAANIAKKRIDDQIDLNVDNMPANRIGYAHGHVNCKFELIDTLAEQLVKWCDESFIKF